MAMNMSYCKFQNTLLALEECMDTVDDDQLSPEETKARSKLAYLCAAFADEFECCEFEDLTDD